MENGSKQIWLGPVLGNNRSRLIERCADLVSKGQADSFLYIAASHPLLEIVTQGILDGGKNPGLWGELPVYLFRGFVRRLLSTAVDADGQRVSPRVPIDRETFPLKRSLISQILERLLAATLASAQKALRDGACESADFSEATRLARDYRTFALSGPEGEAKAQALAAR